MNKLTESEIAAVQAVFDAAFKLCRVDANSNDAYDHLEEAAYDAAYVVARTCLVHNHYTSTRQARRIARQLVSDMAYAAARNPE